METEIRNLFRKMRQVGLGHDETSKALLEGFNLDELEIIISAAMSAAFSQMNLITGDSAKTAIALHNDEASKEGNRRLRKNRICNMATIFADIVRQPPNTNPQDEPDLTELPVEFIQSIRKFAASTKTKYTSLAIIRQMSSYGYDEPLALFGLREESDKEYQGRLKRAQQKETKKKAKQDKKAAKELETYEKLKLKYGGAK